MPIWYDPTRSGALTFGIKRPSASRVLSSSDLRGLPYGLQIPGSMMLEWANDGRTSAFERANGTALYSAHSTKKALRYASPVGARAGPIGRAAPPLDLEKEAR